MQHLSLIHILNEVQEQFLKTLENLKALAKTKKNTLEYDEILNAFNGMELTDAKIDMVLEYLEKNHVDILQGKSPEDMPDDMLLESEEDILLSDNEEIELINDVDILDVYKRQQRSLCRCIMPVSPVRWIRSWRLQKNTT